jgi:hypothetical protein
MWQFIILGYLPGTDIQIGYDSITRFLAVFALFYLSSLLIKEKRYSKDQFQELISQKAL